MGQRPTVGVLTPYLGGHYFASLLTGIQRAARRRSARVVAFQTAGTDLFWPAEHETLPLGWERIDGWIGINDLHASGYYEQIALSEKPLVTVSARLAGHKCCAVLPDNHQAVKESVEHLLSHGHTRIAFAGALSHSDIRERYEQFAATLREAGVAADSSLFFPSEGVLEADGRAVGKKLVSARLPCTAVVAATDPIAIGIVEEVQSAGHRVPQDLAIIGFDDVDRAQYTNPPLATVRVAYDRVGEKAAELLLARVLDGQPLEQVVRVPGTLIRRPSCGCTEGLERSSASETRPISRESGWPERFSRSLVGAAANRKINLELVGVDLANAQELSWLRWTQVRHAALGEWRAGTKTAFRRLRIRSVFHATIEPFPMLGSEHLPAQFPNDELCDLLDESGADEILSVVPITGRGSNRGLLTVVGPIEMEPTEETGNLELWAALLSAALDREELMASLRRAFEREREFAETLRQSEERYALAAHGANDGLWDLDVASGQLYLSARWKSMIGYDENEIGAHIDDWFSHVHADDLAALKQALDASPGGRNTHIQHEYRMVHKDGRQVWVLCRGIVLTDSRGISVRVAGSQTDITGRKNAEEQLQRNALHDALTGLPNRALLMDRLEQTIARAERAQGSRFAVLFLDLDHFKTVNESLGHLAGDQLLIQSAQRLSQCVRSIDTVARLGGDEFAIIVADLEDDQAVTLIADRIHEALRAPFDLGGHRVFTSTSVGITLSSDRTQRPEHFLRDAETAMYQAKSQGRARHLLFDGHMHEQAMERLSVEAGVRRALEQEELVLYYQPVVSLETGQVVGVEALIRWNHPERGILAPSEFLPVAEESGLILPVSEWVVRRACEQASRWSRELPQMLRVSVNVAPRQLKDPSLVQVISEHLRRNGLPPSALGLELVESSLIESREAIVDNLQKLRAMGIHIAVDDFGTGYSSLSYLKRLPIDTLKIDRSFTQGIPSDANDTAISTAIIAMARSLGLSVVAEGVETREQAEFLRSHGCQKAQGYYFSRPLPAEDVFQPVDSARPVVRVATRTSSSASLRARR